MKRSIGAMLLAAVATSGKWLSGSPVLSSPGYARFRPTGAALRDPSHPAQAARIQAASAKRAWRGKLLQLNAKYGRHYNEVHKHSSDFDSLNPFYIAK